MAKKQRKKAAKGKTKSQVTYEWLVAKGQEFAKDLRKKATPHEKSFYKTLKDLHYKFEFQVPVICNKKYLYIVDFLLTDYQIFIELDGSQHNTPEGRKKDNLRTKRLRKEGYEPLKLTNRQVAIYTKEQIKNIINTKIMLINNTNSKN